MFVRIEVTPKPELADPQSHRILSSIAIYDPDIYQRIRWSRVLEVFWLEAEVPREQLIEILSEVLWDPVTQWVFSANLMPSAAGKTGTLIDLMEFAPNRPGNFWAIETRSRLGKCVDQKAQALIQAVQFCIPHLKNVVACSGSLLLLEGVQLDENLLALIARKYFVNADLQTWTILADKALIKNDRFYPERVKYDLPRKLYRNTPFTLKGWEGVPEYIPSPQRQEYGLEKWSTEEKWFFTNLARYKNPLEYMTAYLASSDFEIQLFIWKKTFSLENFSHKNFQGYFNSLFSLVLARMLSCDSQKNKCAFPLAGTNFVGVGPSHFVLPSYQNFLKDFKETCLKYANFLQCIMPYGSIQEIEHFQSQCFIFGVWFGIVQTLEPFKKGIIFFFENCECSDILFQKHWLDFVEEVYQNKWIRKVMVLDGFAKTLIRVSELFGKVCLQLDHLAKDWEDFFKTWHFGEKLNRGLLFIIDERFVDVFLKCVGRRNITVCEIGSVETASTHCVQMFWQEHCVGFIQDFLTPKPSSSIDLCNNVNHIQQSTFVEQTSSLDTVLRETASILLQLFDVKYQELSDFQQGLFNLDLNCLLAIRRYCASRSSGENPLVGINNGIVLRPLLTSDHALAVGFSCSPRKALDETVCWMAIDEALRGMIAVGGKIGLDSFEVGFGFLHFGKNFSFNFDELTDKLRLKVLYKWCVPQEQPFTFAHAFGTMPDVKQAKSAEFKISGDAIYLIGPRNHSFGYSLFSSIYPSRKGSQQSLQAQWQLASILYRWISGSMGKASIYLRSIHSITRGGLLVSIAECMLARQCGVSVVLDWEDRLLLDFFGEGFHQFLISVVAHEAEEMEHELVHFGIPFLRLGQLENHDKFELLIRTESNLQPVFSIDCKRFEDLWKKNQA